MCALSVRTIEMPAADLGAENPLPPLRPLSKLIDKHTFARDIPMGDRKYFAPCGYPSFLPYLAQDDYNRIRKKKRFRVAVLENEILRATFLLDFGGRLWSLYHKPRRRELLYVKIGRAHV